MSSIDACQSSYYVIKKVAFWMVVIWGILLIMGFIIPIMKHQNINNLEPGSGYPSIGGVPVNYSNVH